MNVKWKGLARIDAILTNRFVDSERNISHKLELKETLDKESRPRLKMGELYGEPIRNGY